MPEISTFQLTKPNMGAPVRHSVGLDGRPSMHPAVTAVCVRNAGLGWCVLADHPDNHGVSVTNGAECYAEAVCRALNCDVCDLAWYEIDSDGAVDELCLLGGHAGFAPLLEPGQSPRSLEALLARAAKLPGGLPAPVAALLAACCARFARPRAG